ncbi:unnamed protein product [Protopolystoma xenopodis]|uniref:Uncharacterized protein n=1 Tax=Protopolystoma xenopodis TaxID=117903 RepID=A0A448WJ89_9PLAT|nr:unnamed protein product [Protopolystoma xenopodis]
MSANQRAPDDHPSLIARAPRRQICSRKHQMLRQPRDELRHRPSHWTIRAWVELTHCDGLRLHHVMLKSFRAFRPGCTSLPSARPYFRCFVCPTTPLSSSLVCPLDPVASQPRLCAHLGRRSVLSPTCLGFLRWLTFISSRS